MLSAMDDGHNAVSLAGFDPLPLLLTCKQFEAGIHYVYFNSATLVFKSAFPSDSSGDMSALRVSNSSTV